MGMKELDATCKSMGVFPKSPVVPQARFETLRIKLLEFDRICTRRPACWQGSKPAAALTSAEARIIAPPGSRRQGCNFRKITLPRQRSNVTLQAEAIKESRRRITVFIVQHIRESR